MPHHDPTITSGSISFIRPCAVLSTSQGLIHVGPLALNHLDEAGVVATSIVDQVDECAVMEHGVFQRWYRICSHHAFCLAASLFAQAATSFSKRTSAINSYSPAL
jgi:hypothetical protein